MNALLLVRRLSILMTLPAVIGLSVPDKKFLKEQTTPFGMTEVCLGCICEAATNCNLTIGCWRGRCGPLLISRDYWLEAGSPVPLQSLPDNVDAYLACVNNPLCAGITAKQYVVRYAQDCNGDGELNCDDYARIHYLGGKQCRLPIEHYGFYKIFSFCKEAARWLNG